MSENTTQKNKKTPIFIIAGVAAFIAIIAVTGVVGEKAEDRIADAQSSNKELQDQITILQGQMNTTAIILNGHETVLIQHDQQIRNIANGTDIIGNWASQFSNNINDRVTALEGNNTGE